MKKLILTITSAVFMMLTFASCTGAPASSGGASGGANNSNQMIIMLVIWGALFAGVYFLMIRPNSKKKKEEQALRDNLEIGDDITTIGGIVGRIISIKEDTDTIIIETSSDRTKMQFKRWCIATVDTVKDEPKTATPEKKGFFGKKSDN